MPTTTFIDVRMTEDFDHRYEKQDYSFSEGDKVRVPLHTASKMVNNWDVAEWTGVNRYEVDQKDYEDVVMSVKDEKCQVELDDGETCGRKRPCQYHEK